MKRKPKTRAEGDGTRKPQAVKPSPLPWKSVPTSDGLSVIVTNDDVLIATMEDNADDPAVNEVDAALIVRAVNAHAGLVDIKDKARALAAYVKNGDSQEHITFAIRELTDALKNAGEKI